MILISNIDVFFCTWIGRARDHVIKYGWACCTWGGRARNIDVRHVLRSMFFFAWGGLFRFEVVKETKL